MLFFALMWRYSDTCGIHAMLAVERDNGTNKTLRERAINLAFCMLCGSSRS